MKAYHNTIDGRPKPQPVAKPPRKRKQPVPDKKQRADRRQEVKVRLEEINNERVKHNEILGKASAERQRYIQNLNDKEKREKEKMNAVLDEHFMSGSTGKLMDKVIQSETIEPELNQLRGNITKRDNQISWHRAKLKALSTEQHQLNQELDRLGTIDMAYAVYDQLQVLFDSYKQTENEYMKVRELAAAAEALDPNYFSTVPAPSQFHATVASTYLARYLGKPALSTFIGQVQAIGGVYEPQNPFHTEYVDRDTSETDAHVPLRRPDFNTPRSIIK